MKTLPHLLTASLGAPPVPTTTPPDYSAIKTGDDLIGLLTTNDKTLATDQAAVVAADAAVTNDLQVQASGQAFAAGVFALTGPISFDNGDGTLTTYLPTTTAPGYRTEVSKKSSLVLPTPPAPNPHTP